MTPRTSMSWASRFAALFRVALVLSAWGAATGASAAPLPESGPVIVFAAASLKTALDKIAAQWPGENGRRAVISYAATPALARQIEHEAPAQIFISADLEWMDYVAGKGLIAARTRSNLLGNSLVLVAPKATPLQLEVKPGFDLGAALGNGRLAIADVRSVPAGKYGRAALESLGVWTGVAGRLAQTETVRAALLLVSRGEAPLGLVYRTDATSDPGVRIVAALPETSHPPIVYPIALTTKATAAAENLLAFIKSPAATPHFAAEGFKVLD